MQVHKLFLAIAKSLSVSHSVHSACFFQGNASTASESVFTTKWCSSALGTSPPYDDGGVCMPEGLQCPEGFRQPTGSLQCLYPSLPTAFYNCFSCVVHGHVWVTNVTAEAFAPPNIGVCFPLSAISNFSLACPMCRAGSVSIYQDVWQCPASQLASCAACTTSNFVWCSSESRCANALSSCRDRLSGVVSKSQCVTSESAAALPTCSACLQQNGPLQSFEQLSQWCRERVCCGSNVTGNTSIHSSAFVIAGAMCAFLLLDFPTF
jgi:hypothetical protein